MSPGRSCDGPCYAPRARVGVRLLLLLLLSPSLTMPWTCVPRDVVGAEVRSYALGWLRKVALEMHAELAEEIRRVDPQAHADCRCAACGASARHRAGTCLEGSRALTCAWACAAFDTCTPNPACLPTRRPLRAFSPGRLPPRPAAWSAVMENGIISSCCTRRPRRPCSLLARASTTSSMHSGARGAGASFVSQNTASWCWVGFALVRACVRACTHLLCA